jgi:branched-chain amino acid transport system permease protein
VTYFYQITIDFLILALLAASMNLLLGGGLLLVSQAASFGVGAYVAALCNTKLGIGFIVSTALGAFASGAASLLVALPARNLRGDSFVMLSLAVQVLIYTFFLNAVTITGGPYGLSGISKPRIGSQTIQSSLGVAVLYLGIVAACIFLVNLLTKSGFGRALTAIREDELAAKGLGIPVARRKTEALFLCAVFAGLAGSLYAQQASYLDPTSFTLDTSILIVSVCVIGGMGSIGGALAGALVLTLIQEVLRFLEFPSSVTGPLRLLTYGLLVVWIVLKRPSGLMGKYAIQ